MRHIIGLIGLIACIAAGSYQYVSQHGKYLEQVSKNQHLEQSLKELSNRKQRLITQLTQLKDPETIKQAAQSMGLHQVSLGHVKRIAQ